MGKERIAIVGAGAAGCALALALYQKGYPIVGVASRRMESAQLCARLVDCGIYSMHPPEVTRLADAVFITTPDGVIETVCTQIADQDGIRSGSVVAHLSGALSAAVLHAAAERGAKILSLHPIQTLADPHQGAQNLIGSYFSLEGAPEAVAFGKRLVEDLEGCPIVISAEAKPLYHSALCVASNYLVALADLAAMLLQRMGMEKAEALHALLPLLRGTVTNLAQMGLPEALTGPISRGDVQTLVDHLGAIRRIAPEALDLYKTIGIWTLHIARQKGALTDEAASALQVLLEKRRA